MPPGKSSLSVLDGEAEVEAAEVEAAEVEAAEVEAAEVEAAESTSAAATEDGDATDSDMVPAEGSVTKARRFHFPNWKTAVVGIAVLGACALATASGYMIWHHKQAVHERQLAAEYAAGARQGVITLMSLDFNKATEDVRRIIDNSTGPFRDDFLSAEADFIKAAQDSKVVAEATVQSTAVESMTADSAVVLVAATSKVTNTAGAKQEPRSWRLSVNVVRDGGQIKLSKVEFVP